jgi:hypothetical protein
MGSGLGRGLPWRYFPAFHKQRGDMKLLRGWAWQRSFIGLCFSPASVCSLLPRKDSTEYCPGSATPVQMAVVLENSILRRDLYFVDRGHWIDRAFCNLDLCAALCPVELYFPHRQSLLNPNLTMANMPRPLPVGICFLNFCQPRQCAGRRARR